MKRMLLILVASLLPTIASGKEITQPPTVQVTATGSVAHEPDQVRIMLSVETFAEHAEKAAKENAIRMNTVFKAISTLGLDRSDIQTVAYSLDPRYDHGKRQSPEPVGYTARNMIQVTLDSLELVGKLVDTALSSGANRATELRFELENSEKAHLGALKVAMKLARAQAEVLAVSAGRKLGPAINILSAGPGDMVWGRQRAFQHQWVPCR
jgi:hypothetical protein